jgi:hypothetical protein
VAHYGNLIDSPFGPERGWSYLVPSFISVMWAEDGADDFFFVGNPVG